MDVSRILALLLTLIILAAGCTTATTSNTARTATEQLLVSTAVDQALDKVDFTAFAGRAVFLDENYIDCVDKTYVVASVRHRLLHAGAALVPATENAEVVMELRSGAVGTTTSESFVGVPEIALPGMLTLPELRLATRSRQDGTAKLGIVAYDAHTGQILGSGGMSVAQSSDNNWYVAGVGPYRNGSLRSEMERGTSGRAAWSQRPIPAFVTFDTPPRQLEQVPEIQFTSASQESPAEPEELPVPQEAADAPSWAQ